MPSTIILLTQTKMKTIPQLAHVHRAEDRQKRAKQSELTDFVYREVYVNQTCLVEALMVSEDKDLLDAGISYEGVVNLYHPQVGDNCSKYRDNVTLSDEDDCCSLCGQSLEDPQEVYEWWLVSEYLEKKLEEQGEPILKTEYGSWWGRTCSGQVIMLDTVIEDIYQSLNK